MKENNDREIFTYTTTNGNLNKINSKNESSIISDKVNSFSEEEQNNELINREIPININNISEIRSKTNLSIEQERIIQKLPTFRIGEEKIHDEIVKQWGNTAFKSWQRTENDRQVRHNYALGAHRLARTCNRRVFAGFPS